MVLHVRRSFPVVRTVDSLTNESERAVEELFEKRRTMKTIALVFIAACGFTFAGAPEGKSVFEAKCQPCHGPNGEGKPAIAKMMKVEMHALGSKEIQAKTDAQFKQTINNGQGKMKPVTGLTEKQVEDVNSFVRTLK
jgi:cytochrome c553